MIAGLLALIVTAFFTGAATYVSLVEQPARLVLDDSSLLREWQPSYKRGAAMQASIAIVACVLGLIAWWQTSTTAYIVGAILIILPWPWTLGVMLPTNRLLEAMNPEDGECASPSVDRKMGPDAPHAPGVGRAGHVAFAFGIALDDMVLFRTCAGERRQKLPKLF